MHITRKPKHIMMAKLQGNKGKIAASTIAAAMLAATPFIGQHEGYRLDSYEDVVGVWTVCSGIAGVSPNIHMTRGQCDSLNKSTIGMFMSQVVGKLNVDVSPKTLAAHTSFAYNIGIAGYSRSKTLKLTNAGEIEQGCNAMANWETAGGMDCNVRANNCYGVVQRRNDEIKLCLAGLNGNR